MVKRGKRGTRTRRRRRKKEGEYDVLQQIRAERRSGLGMMVHLLTPALSLPQLETIEAIAQRCQRCIASAHLHRPRRRRPGVGAAHDLFSRVAWWGWPSRRDVHTQCKKESYRHTRCAFAPIHRQPHLFCTLSQYFLLRSRPLSRHPSLDSQPGLRFPPLGLSPLIPMKPSLRDPDTD